MQEPERATHMSGWVPLHVHSYYSLLQATPSPEMLARRAASEGLTHLALTDTHALYGVVAFAQACRRHHVQPVIGMTIHILNDEPHAPTPSMDASPPAHSCYWLREWRGIAISVASPPGSTVTHNTTRRPPRSRPWRSTQPACCASPEDMKDGPITT